MKIRIANHSIRFRLSLIDVANITKDGRCQVELALPNGEGLQFVLGLTDGDSFHWRSNTAREVICQVPSSRWKDWVANEDAFSWKENWRNSNGGECTVLIEKDWACNDQVEQEQPNTYFKRPNSSPPC